MDDSELETKRKILDFIYKGIPGRIIQKYHKFDFTFKYRGVEYYFGIEITK